MKQVIIPERTVPAETIRVPEARVSFERGEITFFKEGIDGTFPPITLTQAQLNYILAILPAAAQTVDVNATVEDVPVPAPVVEVPVEQVGLPENLIP